MSQQQEMYDTSIDVIPVDSGLTESDDVEPAEVPTEIRAITRGLASETPPTNPLVVLKAARWWYVHRGGDTDPAFLWALDWTRHLATDTSGDVERFDAFLAYLVDLGFADDTAALRDFSE